MTAPPARPVRWTPRTRADLDPGTTGQRYRCACGRRGRADAFYDTRQLAAFPGDWTCGACIAHARDNLGTVTEEALCTAWQAPAAAISQARRADAVRAARRAPR